jgi:hypothetical protein
MINSIEPSAFDEGTCFIAVTRYKLGDFNPYLYKTTDYGKTWVKIVNGIDTEHFTRVIREDPNRKGLLYTGTETGMYISFNDGTSWQKFQLNLPIVPITDLTIKDDNLIVATQGRSLWMLDDLTVLHQLNSEIKSKDYVLFAPKRSYRTKGNGGKKSKRAGTNLENGVITYFNIKNYNKEKDSISLTYLNQNGDTLATFNNKVKEKDKKLKVVKGANKFVWDGRTKGAEKLKGMIFWWANFNGAKVVPGTYKVSLLVNNEEQSKTFKILADPRSEASIDDMQKQFDFVSDINKTIESAHQSIKKIRKINKQLETFTKQYANDKSVKDLVKKAEELKESFSEIEKALYQTQNKSNQDPLNFPIRLTNKLGHLNSLVTFDDFSPTDQDIAVNNELTSKVNKQIAVFDTLLTKEIKSFNDAFNSLKLDYLFVE